MRRTVRWCWRRTVPALWALSVLGLVGLLGSVPPLAATPVGPAHAYNYDESAAVAPAATIAHAPGEAWDAIGAAGTTSRSTGVDGHVYDPARSFVAPRVTSGATNAAGYARLLDDLDFRQAASIFDEAGGLKPSVISNSRPIIPGDQLGNRQVIDALTSDGSNIADWAKYSTSTVQGPSGPFQAHFYHNSATGVANYSIDYKVVFNNGVGG